MRLLMVSGDRQTPVGEIGPFHAMQAEFSQHFVGMLAGPRKLKHRLAGFVAELDGQAQVLPAALILEDHFAVAQLRVDDRFVQGLDRSHCGINPVKQLCPVRQRLGEEGFAQELFDRLLAGAGRRFTMRQQIGTAEAFKDGLGEMQL